jgi:hypothetical protein
MTIRALEALARTHTVMFDKTGTLTVGGARLIAVETAPGESADEVLRLAGSLEQASHHIVAAAIVEAALARGLAIEVPHDARETMGSGLEGRVGDRKVCVGSHELVHGARKPEQWAVHVLRHASWRSALSVFVAVDGRTVGALLLGDELRRETPRAVQTVDHQPLYVTPVSRIEFLLGKQLPYIAVAMTNFALMLMIALFVFQVPLKGSFPTLLLGALIPMTYFVPISAGRRRRRDRHGRAGRQRPYSWTASTAWPTPSSSPSGPAPSR